MNQARACWLLAGFALLGGASAHAAEPSERELGWLLGGRWGDNDLVGGEDSEPNPVVGLRYGQRLDDDFTFFGDVTYGAYEGSRIGFSDADVGTVRGGLEWLFSKQRKYNWFLSGGMGLMSVNSDGDADFTRPMASLGVGQAWDAGGNEAFRWEVRADHSFGNGSLPGASLSNVQALLGYAWGLSVPPDSDGDHVPNRFDQCLKTPIGADVDARGCPADSDGDAILDDRDRCPAVPAPYTADGCPRRSAARRVDEAGPAVTPAPPIVPDAAVPAKLVLEGVNFEPDSVALDAASRVVLDNVAAMLKAWGEVRIEVAGHTDSVSSGDHNLRLSLRRAGAVRAYLIERGVAADRLTAKGYGESVPRADNRSAEGRSWNRRVELVPQR